MGDCKRGLLLPFGEFRMCGSLLLTVLPGEPKIVLRRFHENVLEPPFHVDLDRDDADFRLHVCADRCKDIANQAGQ